MDTIKIVRPDSKTRVTLGHWAEGVSGYNIKVDEETLVITLTPNIEIPLAEAWLFRNKAALRSVRKGLQQSAKGELISRGSFAKYAKDSH